MNTAIKKIFGFLGGLLCLVHPHGVTADVMDVWHEDLTKPAAFKSVEDIVEPTSEPTPQPKTIGEKLVDVARQYIGVPYVWGGTSPSGFDCSGLVQYVYSQLGIYISRTTYTQVNDGWAVPKDELQLGDIVLFGSPAHHVGMYVGDGMFIEAPYSGANVRITPLSSRSDFNCARRIVE